jgi:hypothetical protein
MMRKILAGLLGAAGGIVLSVVFVAVISALFGVTVMYEPDRADYGVPGAQMGVIYFVAIGLALVWPFPVIAMIGAVIAIAGQGFFGKRRSVGAGLGH